MGHCFRSPTLVVQSDQAGGTAHMAAGSPAGQPWASCKRRQPGASAAGSSQVGQALTKH